MKTHRHAESALKSRASAQAAARQMTFFKTGKGQYAEGDRFMGVTVPVIRTIVKDFYALNFPDLETLLQSPWNESRLLALLILGERYKHGGEKERARIYNLYLKNARRVNNWNLVDASAHYIVGAHLLSSSAPFSLSPRPSRAGEGEGGGGNDRAVLYKLAKSKNMWERRIAVVSTFAFIRAGDFTDILKLSALLLNDEHDLMHKACGWMLREVGKKDVRALETFLDRHYANMPRTMLRYAIENFPEPKRKAYLKKK